jgi:hypothetical protein
MNNSKTIIYALDCEHAAPGLTTLVNGVLRCAWCQEPRQIIGVVEYEWRARCAVCTYARWAGLSKHNASIFARGHVSHHPAHRVHVEYARNPEAVKTARKMLSWNVRKSRP